jgi:hypothetical protein
LDLLLAIVEGALLVFLTTTFFGAFLAVTFLAGDFFTGAFFTVFFVVLVFFTTIKKNYIVF